MKISSNFIRGRIGDLVFFVRDGEQHVRRIHTPHRKRPSTPSYPQNQFTSRAEEILDDPEQKALWEAYASKMHYTTPGTSELGQQTCSSLVLFVAECLRRSLDTVPIDVPLNSHPSL